MQDGDQKENTIKILCGDCLDLMPSMANNSVHLVITDPPYGLDGMGLLED